MTTLILEAEHFADARHWHWRLRYADEENAGYPQLAYAEIALDPPGEDGEDWPGTYGWLRSSVANAPDRPAAIAAARRWLGEHLLPEIGPAIAEEAPVTVHVRVKPEEAALLRYPLEFASVADPEGGRFVDLAENNVSFVYQVVDANPGPGRHKDPVGDRLRVLAVFTEPAGATLPTLDVEQRLLASQVDQLAGQQRKAIELRILPYGTTVEKLRSYLEEGEAWDIVHISGYGVTGGLAMWGASPLPLAELAKDLKLIRHRLKVISLVDRQPPGGAGAAPGDQAAAPPSPAAPGGSDVHTAALALAGALDCAVLAFRYPACEPFALTFTLSLFEYLLDKKQPLPGAVYLATKKASDGVPDTHDLCCRPGAVLFGARAVDLPLVPPRQPSTSYDVRQFKMAGFPKQEIANSLTPIALRTRAETALSGSSPYRGVVLTGSAAATQVSALELAYGRRDDFDALIWHPGPAAPSEVPGSFNGLVRSLDRKLPGLRMAEQVKTVQDLRDFVPALTALLEAKLVLVMIAGVDLLLTSQGTWTNVSWELVMNAMAGHQGGSRLVVTASRALAGVAGKMDVLDIVPDGVGGT